MCILIMDVCTYNFWFISGYMLVIGLLYATLAIIRMSKTFLKLHYYVELLFGEQVVEKFHLSACYTRLGCAIFYLPYIQSFKQSLLLIGLSYSQSHFSDAKFPKSFPLFYYYQ